MKRRSTDSEPQLPASRILATPRLELRPGRLTDLESLHALWTSPGVRRYLFDDRTISLDEARAHLEASAASFREQGFGLWLAFERGVAELAGFAGFLTATESGPSLVYGIRAERWGRGIASEAARAVLAYAFGELGLSRVAADVDEPNAASVRVLEKLGMSLVRRAVVNGRPLLYFEVEREPRDTL